LEAVESRGFLVVYDYGAGGVRALMVAPSRSTIETATRWGV
jgi:hypothetical protein